MNFYSGAREGLIGNPVQIGNGPATVIGDEIRNCHYSAAKRNGKVRRVERSESQETCLTHTATPTMDRMREYYRTGQVSWVQPFVHIFA